MPLAEEVQAQQTKVIEQFEARVRRLDRQNWWLWATAVIIMLLLIAALFSFTFPGLFGESNPFFWAQLDIHVRGLLGLVLLFIVFVAYQQALISRLRRHLAGQFAHASELKTRAALLEKLAGIDPMTELYNRRFATKHLETEIARAERHDYPLTALMLDLNSLKRINDTYGHAAGDLAVCEFARNLKRSFRSSDLCVRMGGDEFMVLLPECPAEHVPRALTHLRELEIDFRDKKIPISFAAGWAQHERGESCEQFLERADQALYSDKHTRNAEKQVREAEQRVAQSAKMQTMGQVTGTVAHDFNNLLTIIKCYTQVVLQELPPTHRTRQNVEEIDRAVERASGLTRQLLTFSRTQTLQPYQRLNLNTALHNLESAIRALLSNNIELRIENAPELGTLRADSTQLDQVILNLVMNARDAMPEGGLLTLRTYNVQLDEEFAKEHPGSRSGHYVALEVCDTGTGMDGETKKRVFEPFFTTKPEGKGNGLGLSIVYGVVKQTGSYIWVDSQVGRGSRFTIFFPCADTVAKAVPLPHREAIGVY